jgi:hypothetical protein
MQLDIASARNVLQLIVDGQIFNPTLRTAMLREATVVVLGKTSEANDGASKDILIALDSDPIGFARDLLRIAETRELTNSQAPTSPKADAAILPEDDALKDRLTRVYLGSPAFRICFLVLAVGTALFGVNLGVLTFNTDAVLKIKNDATNAVNQAKAQAETAKIAVEGAVASIMQSTPSIDTVAAKVVDKINVGETEQRVVTLLGQKFDRDVQARTDKVARELDEKIKPLTADVERLTNEVPKHTKNVKDNTEKLAGLETKYNGQLELF